MPSGPSGFGHYSILALRLVHFDESGPRPPHSIPLSARGSLETVTAVAERGKKDKVYPTPIGVH